MLQQSGGSYMHEFVYTVNFLMLGGRLHVHVYRRRSHEPTNQSKWSIYIVRAGGTDSSVRVTVDDMVSHA